MEMTRQKVWFIWRITSRQVNSTCTVKNGVFQNSCLGCLNVHSSTTPNRVFLKPLFEGVTGHLQNTFASASESLKGVLHPNGVTINSHLYVIVSDFLNL